MNILIVTGIFPPDIGGPATYVPMMAEALCSRGHTVRVVTLSDELSRADDGYPFRVFRISRAKLKPLRLVRTVASIIMHGWTVDIWLVCGLALEAALANVLLRKPLLLRVVGDMAWERATAHGASDANFEDFQNNRHALRWRVLQRVQQWWIGQAGRVMVPSCYLARWVASIGIDKTRIVVINNPIETGREMARTLLTLTTRTNIVTVGRLLPLKRVDGILDAIALLEGVGLVVVGDGPERLALERLALTLGISERVMFAGRQSKEEYAPLDEVVRYHDIEFEP